ncbi:MAG: DUF309 domain-containing protein [Candidatus Marinimicrobia bacterium]|jgi:hypothetical protein|nr:DUF309 domain-containing protein [Candidatus Neomarinimicrobiota bacterium]MDP6790100.1 DUF309 domain-containing protein [Candidatus Neomarinimicrobiota bacterium]MDP7072363.1 DUF309 domain-containing protein [Candidatus Neomarinimicrobiota bacterium]|tara:strand:- start:99 stop:524 length:426 start_codon:yes stop_codon:yes gene_type:complete
MPPRKRKLDEISFVQDPVLNTEQDAAFRKGVNLFNSGEYWEAHEAWEDTWMPMTDEKEDDGEIILRGLIQFTAGLHGLTSEKPGLGERNLRKAEVKLSLIQHPFLGIDIPDICKRLKASESDRTALTEIKLSEPSRVQSNG